MSPGVGSWPFNLALGKSFDAKVLSYEKALEEKPAETSNYLINGHKPREELHLFLPPF